MAWTSAFAAGSGGPIEELNNTFKESPGQESELKFIKLPVVSSSLDVLYGLYIVEFSKSIKVGSMFASSESITDDCLPYLSDKTIPTW